MALFLHELPRLRMHDETNRGRDVATPQKLPLTIHDTPDLQFTRSPTVSPMNPYLGHLHKSIVRLQYITQPKITVAFSTFDRLDVFSRI